MIAQQKNQRCSKCQAFVKKNILTCGFVREKKMFTPADVKAATREKLGKLGESPSI